MFLPAYVSRNGELIPPAQAQISVFNPAIYGAYGVYESMQVVRGAPFAMGAHLERPAHSADILGLVLPASLSTIEQWIDRVLVANGMADCTLRLFAAGDEIGGKTSTYIWSQPPTVYPPHYFSLGVSAITFEAARYLPQAKSLNTLASFMAQRLARAAGVHEALLHSQGCLNEGSNSNLFAVVDGCVLTPPRCDVLPGVTRDIVLMLARRESVPIQEARLQLLELSRWEECFITSTSRHIMPVTVIDGRPVGTGRVGGLTQQLLMAFGAFFEEQTRRA